MATQLPNWNDPSTKLSRDNLQLMNTAIEEGPNLDSISQGRNAKYYIKSSGWHRILKIIRGSNGTVTITLGQANKHNSGISLQNISFDFSGFVDFPEIDNDKNPTQLGDNKEVGSPKLILNYNSIFGQSHIVPNGEFIKISRIRIGYPDVSQYSVSKYPYKGDTNFNNPVNCYLDVFIEVPRALNGKDGTSNAININYSGYATSHNTTPIIEETIVPEVEVDGNDTTIYGEALKYYTVDVSEMEVFQTSEEVSAKRVCKEIIKESTLSYMDSIEDATSIDGDISQLQYVPRYNLLKYGGKKISSFNNETIKTKVTNDTSEGTLSFIEDGYYKLKCPNKNFQWFPSADKNGQGEQNISQNNMTHFFQSTLFDVDGYGATSTESDIYGDAMILEPGNYFMTGGLRLLTLINSDGYASSDQIRNSRLSRPLKFTIPDTAKGLYVSGIRFFINYNATDDKSIYDVDKGEINFIPLLIKREGIFESLESTSLDIDAKTVTFYSDTSKQNEIITLPISELQPQFTYALTQKGPVNALKDDKVVKALYVPQKNDCTISTDSKTNKNQGQITSFITNRSDIKVNKKLIQELLPVIVSDTKPDIDDNCVWVSPEGSSSSSEDYIVRRGESDGWYYEKWNSGYCEITKKVSDTRVNLIPDPSGFVDDTENDFKYNKYTKTSRLTKLSENDRMSARINLSKTIDSGNDVTVSVNVVDIGPGIKLEDTPDGSPPLALRGYVCNLVNGVEPEMDTAQYVFFGKSSGNLSTTVGRFSETITLKNAINSFRFYIFYANDGEGEDAYLDLKDIVLQEGDGSIQVELPFELIDGVIEISSITGDNLYVGSSFIDNRSIKVEFDRVGDSIEFITKIKGWWKPNELYN